MEIVNRKTEELIPYERNQKMQKITLDLKTANRLADCYGGIVTAENTYKRCQNDEFRRQVQSVILAPNIMTAYGVLLEAIEKAKQEDEDEDESAAKGLTEEEIG